MCGVDVGCAVSMFGADIAFCCWMPILGVDVGFCMLGVDFGC